MEAKGGRVGAEEETDRFEGGTLETNEKRQTVVFEGGMMRSKNEIRLGVTGMNSGVCSKCDEPAQLLDPVVPFPDPIVPLLK